MEDIADRDNLNRAYLRVKANKGAAGVDGMTVDELADWIAAHKETLIAALLDGSYEPQPVRGVQIPKPGGGMRQLGIPTVVDRLVQQAILQVLDPLIGPDLLGIQLRLSSWTRRASSAAPSAAVRSGRPRHRRGPGLGEILRPGKPRYSHVASGPTDRRQASAAHHSPLLGSGADARRRLHRATRRDTARRSTLTLDGQPAVGRSGQGTGSAWALFLPLC